MHIRALAGVALVVAVAFIGGTAGDAHPARAVASIVVNSAADDTLANLIINGKCDLREAIIAANTNAPAGNCPGGDVGPDTITFNIDGPGPHTINVASQLPTITQDLTIDATTAETSTRCAAPRSLSIIIHGNMTVVAGLILSSSADESVIRGLVINGFVNGVGLSTNQAEDVVIQCNHFGTNREGTLPSPNAFGVTVGDGTVLGSAADPETQRNLVSGNLLYGVGIAGKAELYGNFIGTNLAGDAAIPNPIGVLVISASRPAAIGSSAANFNLISGNTGDGIYVDSAQSLNIGGNRIGTTADGTGNLGNGGDGIALYDPLTHTAIVTNTIGFNAGLPIDLDGDGPTANDAGDGDTGANLRQNYPTVTSASNFLITANTNGFAAGTYLIEFYHSQTCDGVKRPLGVSPGETGPNATAEFDAGDLFDGDALPASGFISATATFFQFAPTIDFYTSEFSPCVEIVPVSDPYDVDCDLDHDAVDALAVMRFLAGFSGDPEPTPPCDADIDNDQDVDLSDVVALRRFLAIEQ